MRFSILEMSELILFILLRFCGADSLHFSAPAWTEIALTVLLAHFKFEPTSDGRKVQWLNHHIMSPHVEGDPDGLHRLPLRITRINSPEN